jgi:hypothetical protein
MSDTPRCVKTGLGLALGCSLLVPGVAVTLLLTPIIGALDATGVGIVVMVLTFYLFINV